MDQSSNNTNSSRRLIALDGLDKDAKASQLVALTSLIMTAPEHQFQIIKLLIMCYSGQYRDLLLQCARSRRLFSPPQKWQQMLQQQLNKLNNPPQQSNSQSKSIFSYLNCFRFWDSKPQKLQQPQTKQLPISKKAQPSYKIQDEQQQQLLHGKGDVETRANMQNECGKSKQKQS